MPVLILLLALIMTPVFGAEDDHGDSFRVSRITIDGNRRTADEVILSILGLQQGELYDSLRVASGILRLRATEIFTDVKVFPIFKGLHGVEVFVLVRETFPLTIDDIGGELYARKYGDPRNELWWRARAGIVHNNFRGRLETLRLRMSFWESRSLGVNWSKPFYPSPWYVDLGAGVGDSPDRSSPWRRFSVVGSSGLGRRFARRSRGYVNLSGWHRRMTYKGPAVAGTLSLYGDTSGRSMDLVLPPRDKDTSWTTVFRYLPGDSVIAVWKGYPNYAEPRFRDEYRDTVFHELMISSGCVLDHRNRPYDPRSGWYAWNQVSTNYLYPGTRHKYVQLDSDFRLYHRGLFQSNTIGYWFRSTLRNNSAGIFKRLTAGGEGSIRGYGQDYLGYRFNADNMVQLSAEYRFPLWTTPGISLPLITDHFTELRNFYTRLDAALFVDHGHLWRTIGRPLEIDAETGRRYYDSGTTAGVGLRLMAPTLRRSGCLDVGFGGIEPRSGKNVMLWNLSLYVDMYF